MKTLSEHLIQYAHYHRDKRNIYTHFAGIPLIVIALFSLLSFELFAGITATHLLLVGSLLFYFRLSVSMGLVMLGFSASCYLVALQLVALDSTMAWLGASVAVFIFGWVLQFIGHYFEGKKPAFVDDLVGLLIGPLFVMAEVLFLLGFAKSLQQQIDQKAGPVH
ncbi:Putative membrane protein [Rheinheimera sp. A13L]|uniref:Mpo1 family 2-hydroxy fatty acid dioxygenase n=1 Tax=Rheinheimera sp. A13L TaxID=506534 RepID=UPI0002125395|nr:Mpo1-like protein [Rheinheimera sp. A13L]EGM79113.1 Putative membrane protein [Rheinheimera sp. A13L]